MSEYRLDLGPLGKVEKMADGRLIADAHITRAGVFTYMNPDGTLRRELRDDADVFDAASMKSARMMPITNRHPTAGLVTPANAKKYMVGSTGERVDRDQDHLRTKVMVNDQQAHLDLESGVNQVSCGYKCDVVKQAGVHPKYGRYDVKQTNIRYNHLAIVPLARAGETARIRMDGAEVVPDLWVRVDEGTTDMADKKEPPAFIKKKIAASKGEKPGDDEEDDEPDDDEDDDGGKSTKKDWAAHYDAMAAAPASRMDAGGTVKVDRDYEEDDNSDDDGEDEEDAEDDDAAQDDPEDTSDKPPGKAKRGDSKTRIDAHLDHYRRRADNKPSALPNPGKTDENDGKRRHDAAPPAAKKEPPMAGEKKELEIALSELATQKLRADEATKALNAEKERADAAVGEVKGLQRQIAEFERERADAAKVDVKAKDEKIVELTERIDAAEVVIAEFPARLAAGVKARVDLEKAAIGVMGAQFNCDGMTDREIMTSVVAKRGGAITNESDAELRGEFRAAVRGDAAWKKTANELARVSGGNQAKSEERSDAAPSPLAKTRDAWKQPLPSAQKKGA